MDEYIFLQNYWWLLISILGALLVFLLFVQGGQTLFMFCGNDTYRNMMVNSLGQKWELSFTTLVVFGGAFFASFPLFYSTSFGGAYWLWMIILFSFIVQAVSYEYRRKPGNIFGTATYDTFLFINGCVGCILLGVAVAMMFFGGEFEVTRSNLLDAPSPVISRWVAGSHGIEAIFNWRNLLLGFAVLFLARTQANLYFMSNIHAEDGGRFMSACKRATLVNGVIFVVFFLAFMGVLLTSAGYRSGISGNVVAIEPYKYLHNYLSMWWVGVTLLVGVILVLYGVGRGALDRTYRSGIWFSGIGTVLVVLTLFWVAGYNDTAYYPSLANATSSLTIRNSSSSLFTLKVMSWVSLIVPVVLAYIAYVWYSMNRKPVTPKSVKSNSESY